MPILPIPFAFLSTLPFAWLPALPGDETAPSAQEPSADEPRETVVTARKWEETLEEVPFSITVVSGETLSKAGMGTVRDASIFVPNLNMVEFTSRRLSFPFMRGIGSGQGEPAVTTYVDGVPQLTAGSTNLPLIDLQRIEFLRGPQSTLYGRNTLGGVINVISADPAAKPTFDVGQTIGNHGLSESRFGYSGPIGGSGAGLTVSLLDSRRHGYTENEFTGHNVDDRDAFFGRAQVYLYPSERSQVRVGVYGERSRDGSFALGFLDDLRDDSHKIDQNFEGVSNRDIIAPSVTYEFFGDSVDFTSISAYQDWDVKETTDFDFMPIDAVRRRSDESQHYLYQEVRFSSSADQDSDVKWLVGLSGFTSDSDRSAKNEFLQPFFPPGMDGIDKNTGDFDDDAASVFGQLSVEVAQGLEVTGGLRYDYEWKDADLRHTFETGGFTVLDDKTHEDDDFDELVPMASVSYELTDNTRIYGLAAKGFKAGGFNLSAPSGGFKFDSETNWTYELGTKSSFFDGRLSVRAALFYIDWDDMQLSLFDPQAGGYIDNVGKSTSKGLELELGVELTEGFDVFGSLGLVDTEFDEFTDPFGVDVEDNDLPFAPEETWALGAQYSREITEGASAFIRAEYAGVGKFYYDAGNLEGEKYQLVNLRGGVQKGNFSANLWVRNLFDEEYIPIAFQPNPGDSSVFVGESGAPRTYGFTLRLSF